jgi:hypothetical protein
LRSHIRGTDRLFAFRIAVVDERCSRSGICRTGIAQVRRWPVAGITALNTSWVLSHRVETVRHWLETAAGRGVAKQVQFDLIDTGMTNSLSDE